ncbi:MAG: 5-methylthioadenosine/S-adenosylhomocysteine deaminase [Clostridia bacterium]|jgi:5-methylthioadenosine/S-adenosylhomocysteine deaminase|nr:SsnA [Clostridiales bacterium]MDK2984738.1 5-methylthioadenosine/S-adenosylhomocysteine deaminase [Clostridia bacterium]
MSNNLLIKNCLIVPMTQSPENSGDYFFKGEIAIEGCKIREVGERISLESWKPDKIIDAEGMIALPGFINCHTHAAMTLLRSYADDLPLMQWLQEKIWPLESKLQAEDVYWGTMLCILEMIKSGTTTFADMYFFMDEVAQAVEESGIRASLSRGLIAFNNGEKSLEEACKFVEKWHGKAEGRITTMLGPHAPYTCPPDFLKKVVKSAEKLDVGIHIHVAETLQEIEEIRKNYGKTPVEYLDELGVFELPALAAHCVHLNNKDIEILSRKSVGVVHNPESNMKLASGIAPIPQLLKSGVTVALGTDGASSNNNLDMMEEMRSAALLHKVNSQDPTVLKSYEALSMATRNGAKVLGMEDEVGQLKAGMKADIILLDFNKPHLKPLHDINAHMVYSASSADVDTVIVNGKILMEKRKILTIDEERIYSEVEKSVKRLTS